jgi:nucleotide-binding universal stress UspA family protein
MKKILVCIDGSPSAKHVLDSGLALAKLTGAKVVLFRSIGLPPAMPAHVWALEEGNLLDALRHDAERYLGECASHVPPESLAGTSTALGVPWQAVCDEAREKDVDLIVIGSHGYSAIDKILGTTAAKVVNHADRSVLIVRSKHPAEFTASSA